MLLVWGSGSSVVKCCSLVILRLMVWTQVASWRTCGVKLLPNLSCKLTRCGDPCRRDLPKETLYRKRMVLDQVYVSLLLCKLAWCSPNYKSKIQLVFLGCWILLTHMVWDYNCVRGRCCTLKQIYPSQGNFCFSNLCKSNYIQNLGLLLCTCVHAIYINIHL